MKINLYFFISNFSYGGASNAILNYLINLDYTKFNVCMIFLDNSDLQNDLLKNIKLIKIDTKIKIFKTFFCFFKLKKILKKSTTKHKKNIFISNINYSNVLSILFLRKIQNLKIILFERTSLKELDVFKNFFTFFKNKIIKFLLKFTYSKADRILANSKTVSLELEKYGLSSEVVYSGSINKLIKSKEINKKNFFNIISVGRLSHQKDYFTLLKSVRLIKSKNFMIKIYGEGEYKKKLTFFIHENNLEKKVKLLGYEKNKDKIYKNADLLVHTAIFEGLPNVLVEALNYGVPIIAAKGYGGISEVLNHGKYGQLFEPQNEIELAKKINQFMQNPTLLQKKTKKSKSYIKNFTYQNSCKSLEKILISVLKH